MNFVQILSTYASIVSIPLALYFARKTAATTSDKARLEIIKTLSYKLSIEHALNYEDIYAVYCSKLREHKTPRVNFGIIDIVHDLQADIMSNAFIENSLRSEMLVNLSHIEVPAQNPAPYGDSKLGRIKQFMVGLLYPTLVGLIIVNVVLFMGNIMYFADLIRATVDQYVYNYEHPNLAFAWDTFLAKSHLNISIPCLIAWSILYIACKHNSFFRRHP